MAITMFQDGLVCFERGSGPRWFIHQGPPWSSRGKASQCRLVLISIIMIMIRVIFMRLRSSVGVSDAAVDVWTLAEVAKRTLRDLEKYVRIVQNSVKQKITS